MNILREIENTAAFIRSNPFIALCLAVGGASVGVGIGWAAATLGKIMFMVGFVAGYAAASLLA